MVSDNPKASDKEAIKLSELIGGSRETLGIALFGIGAIYYEKGNYNEALKYILRDLEIMEEISDKDGIANCYNYLGLAFGCYFLI